MPNSQATRDSIVERGQALYDREIRARVEPGNKGKFLVLDVDTGEYEIDTDTTQAFDRAIARNPNGSRYLLRIGHATAYKIGGRFKRR